MKPINQNPLLGTVRQKRDELEVQSELRKQPPPPTNRDNPAALRASFDAQANNQRRLEGELRDAVAAYNATVGSKQRLDANQLIESVVSGSAKTVIDATPHYARLEAHPQLRELTSRLAMEVELARVTSRNPPRIPHLVLHTRDADEAGAIAGEYGAFLAQLELLEHGGKFNSNGGADFIVGRGNTGEIARAKGGVLFVDAASAGREEPTWRHQLLMTMEERNLAVVVMGTPDQVRDFYNLDMGLESRIRSTIDIAGSAPRESAVERARPMLNRLVGLGGAKAQILRLLAEAEKREEPVVRFETGPAGSGTSTTAQVIANALERPIHMVPASHLIAPYEHHGAELAHRLLAEHQNGVIFIDEAHQLFESPSGQEALTAMLHTVGPETTLLLRQYNDRASSAYAAQIEARDPLQGKLLKKANEEGIFLVDLSNEHLAEIFDRMAADQPVKLPPAARTAALEEIYAAKQRAAAGEGFFGNARTVADVLARYMSQ